jgi:hypothetical protein
MTDTTTAPRLPDSLLAYVPGSTVFDRGLRERRTDVYRTWHSPHRDMAYGAECLLCGEWSSSYQTRQGAEFWVQRVHARYCHVLTGCHCRQPHITAAMAARIGIRDSYPLNEARTLFRMAGGVRKYLPPQLDLNRVPFGGPEYGSGGYRWTR